MVLLRSVSPAVVPSLSTARLAAVLCPLYTTLPLWWHSDRCSMQSIGPATRWSPAAWRTIASSARRRSTPPTTSPSLSPWWGQVLAVCQSPSGIRSEITHRRVFCVALYKVSTGICALLGYYIAYSGNSLPTFRDNLSVPFSRVNKFGFFIFEDGTYWLSRNVSK